MDVADIMTDTPPSAGQPIRCQCLLPATGDGCGDACLNRLLYAECQTDLCPCGDRCANRRIQQHHWWPHLERFHTGTPKGLGVRTKQATPPGSHYYACLSHHVFNTLALHGVNKVQSPRLIRFLNLISRESRKPRL